MPKKETRGKPSTMDLRFQLSLTTTEREAIRTYATDNGLTDAQTVRFAVYRLAKLPIPDDIKEKLKK